MTTKLRLADVAEQQQTHEFTVHEGIEYLDAVSGLIRYEYDDRIYWVGEGCKIQDWLAIYDSIPRQFRVVKKVKFVGKSINTFNAERVQTLDELDVNVKYALFQLRKAREELAEYTRITRKAEVRNAAREYEV